VPQAPGSIDAAITGFKRTDVWIFDLDNTLYPADTRLFAQVDQKMGEFIAHYLGVPFAYARHLQKSYYRQFGTTLTGLMQVHKMDPTAFLDYVHDLDLSGLAEHPELAAAIRRLPGRKLIFTNGSRAHAERVAGKLGILPLFEDIFDIVAAGYVPKPDPACYDLFLKAHGVAAARAAMFEDMPHNLEAPHALGMTTVLVRSDANEDHPIQRTMRSWAAPPAHVHHMTFDLPEFLGVVAGASPPTLRRTTTRPGTAPEPSSPSTSMATTAASHFHVTTMTTARASYTRSLKKDAARGREKKWSKKGTKRPISSCRRRAARRLGFPSS
jgi:putative hydrolase of the HAD superfamily